MADENNDGAGSGNTGTNNTADAPQWIRDELTSVRQEAAKYRTQLREKETELTATLEKLNTVGTQVEDAVNGRTAADFELLKLNVALAAGIPGENAAGFADRLKGKDEAELRDDAEELRKYFGGSSESHAATDHSQGRGSESSTGTPQDEFAGFLKAQFESKLR